MNTSKKHLVGGTLREVMAKEIIRVLQLVAKHDTPQPTEAAAMILGITPRTLIKWRGPIEKGGWKELQVDDAVGKFMAKVKKKKPTKRGSKGCYKVQ